MQKNKIELFDVLSIWQGIKLIYVLIKKRHDLPFKRDFGFHITFSKNCRVLKCSLHFLFHIITKFAWRTNFAILWYYLRIISFISLYRIIIIVVTKRKGFH